MAKGASGRQKKEVYLAKLESLLQEYPKIFLVNVDNVGSNQMHQIRQKLRGEGVVLMGKNTMVRKVLRGLAASNSQFEKLLAVIKGNIGFVFTKGDLKEIRSVITENRVQAPAKAGALAPVDVVVPAGNTGQPPDKTSFFQALGVPTKISRGTIEIINDVPLIASGTRVGSSEAALLNMLNISPFTYGLTVVQVYEDGALFSPEILDVEESAMLETLMGGIKTIASISLALGYPTTPAVPHLLINGYKNLLAIAISSDYCFPAAEELKDLLNNPEKLAALASAASAAPAAGGAPAAKEEAKVEEEEESDDDMGFGLFD
ncbi:MAG: hypothetical protein SGCHY_002638 [Lobulomycetales sp.]